MTDCQSVCLSFSDDCFSDVVHRLGPDGRPQRPQRVTATEWQLFVFCSSQCVQCHINGLLIIHIYIMQSLLSTGKQKYFVSYSPYCLMCVSLCLVLTLAEGKGPSMSNQSKQTSTVLLLLMLF